MAPTATSCSKMSNNLSHNINIINNINIMTKNELADALTERTTLSRTQCLKAIDGLIDCINEALLSGNNIYLRGLGTFHIVQRKARKARNICAGTDVTIPARRELKFKPSIQLKNQIHEK